MKYLAEIEIGKLRGKGLLGLEGEQPVYSPNILNQVISTAIGVMTVVAIIWFVIQFFVGAIGIVASGGDKQKMVEAKQKITSGVIGLVVVIAAIFLIDLIGYVLGIDNILNPADVILRLGGEKI